MAGYGDDAGFQAWLDANGETLPSPSPSPAVLRQRGSVYVDGVYATQFPGAPTGGYAQERAWPRTGATFYGDDIPSDVIPTAVVEASYVAALAEANSPGSLSVTATGQTVKREKVGPIEVEYSDASGMDAVKAATPMLSQIEGLLAPLLKIDAPAIYVV